MNPNLQFCPARRFERFGLALVLAVFAVVLLHGNWLWRWDRLFYDWQLASESRPPADDIVIVAIDEQSLRELGRWPWSRRIHADLVRKLTAAGARAIALDIVFAEPSANDPAADADLAAALTESGRVVLPVLNEQTQLDGQLLETLPIPILATAASGLGHVDVDLDLDGIARSVYLKAGLGSPRWSTLALALLESVDPTAGAALPGERAAPAEIPSPYAWARDYHVLIPFAGPPGHFRHVSYAEALHGTHDPTIFRDRFVLVGMTAAGLGDMLPTPVSGLTQPMSGVEFNANVLDTLRRGVAVQRLQPAWSTLLTVVLVLSSVGMCAVKPSRWTLSPIGLSMALTLIVSLILLHVAHRWFPLTPVLLAQALSYPLWSWRRLRQAARSLFVEQERAQAALRSIGDAVITTDAVGVVEYLNPTAEILLGRARNEVLGRPLGAIFRILDESEYKAEVDLAAWCLEKKQTIKLPEHSLLVGHTGQEYAIRASAAPIRDEQGRMLGVVLAISDLSEARRLTEQMAYQATHDALTGLPNRNLLRDRLQHAIAHARRTTQGFALVVVDLDHFKKVNESLGHTVGDQLLQCVAARLRSCGLKADTLARLGGDEFVMVLEDLQQEDWVILFARSVLTYLESPFLLEEREYFITASIGICLFPRDGEEAETLLKNADSALYRAKEKGHGTVQCYAQDMHVRAVERLRMERNLRHALERQEFELHYQPQLDLRRRRIIGVEALLRWRDAQRELIPPIDFIPLAEETGLIEMIGEWVLRTACAQAKAWQREGLPALRMAVNLSPRQFQRPGLVDLVAAVLWETGLEANCLDLEITEGLLMHDVEGSIAILRQIKAMGVRLSIDDFGTGYSSLSYLKRFPIDQLKIDRSFVRDVGTDQDDTAITLAVIAMAHSMRLEVVAEGVETKEQLAFLRANQCDVIQGYYLSRPAPPSQIATLLREKAPALLAGR